MQLVRTALFVGLVFTGCAAEEPGQSPSPRGGSGRGGSSSAGTSGSGGTGATLGSAGASGASGVSGATGSGGTNNDASAGIGGSGAGGSSGATGSAGSGGTAGSAGSAGTNGTGGSAGASGTGGSAGASGTGGSAGSSGTGGTSGTGGSAGTGGTAGGCGANLLPIPEDMTVRGPWDVGVRTVTIGRLTVEIFYPAEPGSTAGKPEATYDLRAWLPPQERSKVPDDHSPAVGPIGGHLYRDVPVDAGHGPYPVVVFIHGTASVRIASGSTNVHWASRGFVVLAADYPGLGLMDQLNSACGYPLTGQQMIPQDVNAQIQALTNPSGSLAFLSGRVDMKRLGISGHSQGGCLSSTLSATPDVQIVIPMSGSTATSPSSSLKSLLYISGMSDTVIGYNGPGIGSIVCPPNPLPAANVVTGYQQSPGAPVIKRLVGITGGGHLVPTDLCQKNAQGRNAVQEAQASGVCGVATAVIIGLPALFDCGTIDMATGIKAVNYASTAALEETLHCKNRSSQFSALRTAIPQIGDYQHVP